MVQVCRVNLEPKAYMIQTFLKKLDLFVDLPQSEIENIARNSIISSYRKNQFILLQGDFLQMVYIVMEGKLHIVRPTLAARDILFDILGPGDLLGLVNTFVKEAVIVSFQTVEPSKLICISIKQLLYLFEKYPKFCLKYSYKLARRLQYYVDFVSMLSVCDVEERITFVLGRLYLSHGKCISITHQSIAEMAGTTRVTASKILETFQRQGTISYKRGKLSILNEKDLHTTSLTI